MPLVTVTDTSQLKGHPGKKEEIYIYPEIGREMLASKLNMKSLLSNKAIVIDGNKV